LKVSIAGGVAKSIWRRIIAPPKMSLGVGTKLGPYEILSLIGTGGMGDVYKARDTRLDRFVAIKIS
jgi:serine/threonine protein kinase